MSVNEGNGNRRSKQTVPRQKSAFHPTWEKSKKKAIRWQWEIKSTESLRPKTNSQKLVNNNTGAPSMVQLLSEKIHPLLIADQGATSNILTAAVDEMRTNTHCLLSSCPIFWKIKWG